VATTTLHENEVGRTESRVTLSEAIAKHIACALSDEFSLRIIVSTVDIGKTVQDISVEQAVPLSTCYRRARELVEQGILVVETIVVTGEGKRYAVYRSSFKSVEMVSDFRGLSASAELNESVAEKFRRWWFYSSYPNGKKDPAALSR
jgi:hypothetical protein